MGKTARLKRERRVAPPPVGKQRPLAERGRLVWGASGALIVIVGIVVGVLLATRSTSKAPAAVMAQAWARGLSLDCGCFGSLAREQVGLGTILRDAAFGLPSLALALWPARLLSVDGAWVGPPDRFAPRSGEAG